MSNHSNVADPSNSSELEMLVVARRFCSTWALTSQDPLGQKLSSYNKYQTPLVPVAFLKIHPNIVWTNATFIHIQPNSISRNSLFIVVEFWVM